MGYDRCHLMLSLSNLKASLKANEPLPKRMALTEERVASVFVTLGVHQDGGETEILLTKRTERVETHKGQISFPGGFYEAEDQGDLWRTALREAHEEVGINEIDVKFLGVLKPVHTMGLVSIFPHVGEMSFPYVFKSNPEEVDKLLFLPVKKLLSEGLQTVQVEMGDHKIESPGIYVDRELVWGATARILEQLRYHLIS